ncbi:head-tail connector protein [Jiella sp. MQZ9-1]|uniref:Phage head-tail connector protein n=1 Tax=Jiella flava TaxID=2816857 RepID=A0A939FYS6_9HYPH|nr:head-tail connector protein [Jiella flava]MBO0661829.1 phage head-tail connector protein [Jiella flava]MCD2470469.1 head-tail connector protein [Jiella flava]
MTTIDLGTSAAEPLTLADAKAWARIERDDEDDLIASLITAARQTIERETGLALLRRSFKLLIDPVPTDGPVAATRRPLVSIDAVDAYDATGAPVGFDVGTAIIPDLPGIDAFYLTPIVIAAAVNGVEIDFTAGFGPNGCPADLLLAMKAMVAAGYEARALVPSGEAAGLRPAIAARLLAPYRQARL